MCLCVQCPHSKRCASLARYGCLQEMVLVLKQVLQNTGLDLSGRELRVLADMLIHCYVHQVAHHSLNLPQATAAFRSQTAPFSCVFIPKGVVFCQL